jgi:hypothetical protein
MQVSKLFAVLAAAAFAVTAHSAALAASSNDAGFTYRASPPSSNPHDVFRRNIKVDNGAATTAMAMKDCDCPKMKHAAASPKSGHGG